MNNPPEKFPAFSLLASPLGWSFSILRKPSSVPGWCLVSAQSSFLNKGAPLCWEWRYPEALGCCCSLTLCIAEQWPPGAVWCTPCTLTADFALRPLAALPCLGNVVGHLFTWFTQLNCFLLDPIHPFAPVFGNWTFTIALIFHSSSG